MFAIRYYRMFVRKDGLMTDNKASALLFSTIVEAEKYIDEWKKTSQVNDAVNATVEIVEVTTKIVMEKVLNVVKTR